MSRGPNKRQQLLALAQEGAALHQRRETEQNYTYSRESYDLSHQFRLKAIALLDSTLPGSVHGQHAKDWPVMSQSGPDVGQLVNALLAAAADLEHGYSIPLADQIRRGIGADLLRDAQELFDAGHFRPASIVAFIPLEAHLRSLAESWGVDPRTKKGTWKAISQLNSELHAAGAYGVRVSSDIDTVANIRGEAAHAHGTTTAEDARRVIADAPTLMDQIGRKDT
jgi:hypothetical protein